MRILVIEDDDKIASFVVKGLQQAGMAVDRAASGEEALDLLLATKYDVAIVDIMLPN
ncbi:MAG TPA: response regulator, partial [Acidobacteriota bacterium]